MAEGDIIFCKKKKSEDICSSSFLLQFIVAKIFLQQYALKTGIVFYKILFVIFKIIATFWEPWNMLLSWGSWWKISKENEKSASFSSCLFYKVMAKFGSNLYKLLCILGWLWQCSQIKCISLQTILQLIRDVEVKNQYGEKLHHSVELVKIYSHVFCFWKKFREISCKLPYHCHSVEKREIHKSEKKFVKTI